MYIHRLVEDIRSHWRLGRAQGAQAPFFSKRKAKTHFFYNGKRNRRRKRDAE